MAKNKGTIGKSKAAVATAAPDEFVSSGGALVERIRPYSKQLAIVGVLGVVALIVFAVWRWQVGRGLSAATGLYHRALLIGEVPLADDPLLALRPDGAKSDEVRDLPATFADAAARATAQLAVLDQLERDHAGSGPAVQAGVLRGGALLALGRADDAAAAFRAYVTAGHDPSLHASALEGVGYALEAKATAEKDAAARQAGLEQALAAFEAMQPAEDGSRRALALYHQGRILAVLGRADDARARYDAALTKQPDPGLRAQVEARLASLGGAASQATKSAEPK